MDRSCLNNNIINIQCSHGQLGSTLSTQLSVGSRKVVCLDRYNVATGYVLDALYRYIPFESDVVYAYKLTFNGENANNSSITVSLTLKDNVLTDYVGTGTGEEIAIYFETQIKAGGLTVEYLTTRIGSTLYVYSYDLTASFTDTTEISASTTAVIVGKSSLQSSLDEILNIWNSLTENEICNLIQFAKNAASTGVPVSAISSGCNC